MQNNSVSDPLMLANQKLQALQQRLVDIADTDCLELIQAIQRDLTQAIEDKVPTSNEQPRQKEYLASMHTREKDRPTRNDGQATLLTRLASPPITMLLTVCSVLIIEVIGYFLVDLLPISSSLAAAIMDTLVTTALSLPVIYFLVFKRMQTQVRQLQKLGKTLQEREAEYHGIVEDQTELICWINPQAKITFLNGAVSRYAGVPSETMIGKDYLSWFFPEDVPEILNQVSCLTPDHPITTGEYRHKTTSEDIRWISWTLRALYNQTGELIRYQSVGRDTTDYHRASIALQEARDGLEQKVQKRTLEIDTLNQALRGEIATRKNAENA